MAASTQPASSRRSPKGRPLGIALLQTDPADGAPTYVRLYRQIRHHILSDALRPGTHLPSARLLAADLGVSRNTVEAAYAQLRAEGFITRRVGAGTVVAADAREEAPFARPAGRRASRGTDAAPAPPPLLSRRGEMLHAFGADEIAGDLRSGPCATDVGLFPASSWQRLVAREARRGPGVLRPADAQGMLRLRSAICAHVRVTRGVVATPEQVVVMSSTQQAIALAASILLDPGDTAVVEDPGYRAARGALLAAGAVPCPVPVDAKGLVTDRLPPGGARLVYVTPSHQFPLGTVMALDRRLALLAWATRTGAWILEDDYDSEFRHDDRAIAALQGLDTFGRVLYVGTWNKVLFPGLRLAYLVAPPILVPPLVAARRMADGPSNPVMQGALAEFLERGYLAAYLRQARRHYTQRRDALVRAVRAHWGPDLRIGAATTGLHLVVHLPTTVDDEALASGASATPLGVAALSRYYLAAPAGRGLMLSYGASTPEVIDATVRAMAAAVRTALGRSPS